MTMEWEFHSVDVFADAQFGGNPLAVFFAAAGLDDARMAALGREFNYSEITFVLPPANAAHTAQVAHLHPHRRAALRRPPQCRHRLRAGQTCRATRRAPRAFRLRGSSRPGSDRPAARCAWRAHRRRAHRAAAALAPRRHRPGKPSPPAPACRSRRSPRRITPRSPPRSASPSSSPSSPIPPPSPPPSRTAPPLKRPAHVTAKPSAASRCISMHATARPFAPACSPR